MKTITLTGVQTIHIISSVGKDVFNYQVSNPTVVSYGDSIIFINNGKRNYKILTGDNLSIVESKTSSKWIINNGTDTLKITVRLDNPTGDVSDELLQRASKVIEQIETLFEIK